MSTVPGASAAAGDTRFYYDANENRVKLINKAGNVYHFVYDPTASIPAVVYEEGPAYRYLNVLYGAGTTPFRGVMAFVPSRVPAAVGSSEDR